MINNFKKEYVEAYHRNYDNSYEFWFAQGVKFRNICKKINYKFRFICKEIIKLFK